MKDLIERLGKATGPDRELGNAILFAVGWIQDEVGNGPNRSTVWVSPDDAGDQFFDGDHPNPTASIDAALTLMPEGHAAAVGTMAFRDNPMNREENMPWATYWTPFGAPHSFYARTPPLALCIAAMEARRGTLS